jgi:tRNA wybutosine-synthesizing protein 1
MVLNKEIKKKLKKQHYEIVSNHSAVQICRWTKKSLRDEGVCYKEKFYGIKSHLCCQMTPAVMWCDNKCLHCWRAIELTLGDEIKDELNSPKEIVDGCIKAQRKLLQGFKIDKNSKKKQLSRANMKKYKEAQEPMQFAISLSGEPTIYKDIGGLIEELRKRGKTSFLVTNGLHPEKLRELRDKKQLPTQLYISVNSSNEKKYVKFHRSSKKDAWKRLNESLSLMKYLPCRNVFRINLIKDFNMSNDDVNSFARLIAKSKPLFVELKGFMSVGYARERLGYEKMPWHEDVKEFAEKLSKKLKNLGYTYRILDEHEFSRAVVLGKNKDTLKIKEV